MKATLCDFITTFGRILLALLFLLSGIRKLSDPSATIGYIESSGFPFAYLGYAIALTVELGLAACLIVGYKTRLVAALITVFTFVSTVYFHNLLIDSSQFVQFFKNVAIMGGLLQVYVLGGGTLSLDAGLAALKVQPAR